MGPDERGAAWLAEVAEDFAARLAERDPELHLDLTPPTLVFLDGFVDGAMEVAAFETNILPATAAYVGEVVVRAGGGQWVFGSDGRSAVRTRTGHVWDPTASVRDRASRADAPTLGEAYAYAMAGAAGPSFGPDLQTAMWSWGVLCVSERAVAGISMRYDAASFDRLDDECDALAERSLSDDDRSYALLTMGGYLGEAIRYAAGGVWQQGADQPVLVVDERLTCHPLGKVAKRIDEGPEDSLRSFFDVALLMASGELPGAP